MQHWISTDVNIDQNPDEWKHVKHYDMPNHVTAGSERTNQSERVPSKAVTWKHNELAEITQFAN